jgi:hypothetical protein
MLYIKRITGLCQVQNNVKIIQKTMYFRIFGICILAFVKMAFAEESWFPFTPPWNDTTHTVIDVGNFLNDCFAGIHGFLTTNNGHFYFEDGTRGKFFGVNLCFGANFPSHEISEIIAKRLKKFGFNLVRLHLMDFWAYPEGILNADCSTNLHPEALDRLDYLIYQLKQNGIYVDFNLLVLRRFDCFEFIPVAESLLPGGKYISFFEPTLIELQKQFAYDLLTHMNSYTNLRYCDDPVVAMVEITNENSLFDGWYYDHLNGPMGNSKDIPLYYSDLLDSLWNAWLLQKYGSRDSLEAVWNIGSEPQGPERIRDGSFEGNLEENWELRVDSTAIGTLMKDSTTYIDGQFSARIEVNSTGGMWSIYLRQRNLSTDSGVVYEVSFWAKASPSRKIRLSCGTPGHPNGVKGKIVNLTTEWRKYVTIFEADSTDSNGVEIAFALGDTVGTVWFDLVSFREAGVIGLRWDEDPALGNVNRMLYRELIGYTENRVADLGRLYYNLEVSFFDKMKAFLRDTVGVRVPLTGSNRYYGLPDIKAQSSMDYLDSHAYWQSRILTEDGWFIPDHTPMVKDSIGGTIFTLCLSKVKDRPLTISEYNHPAPHFFQCEAPIFISAYGAFHDWDAICFFAYHHYSPLYSDNTRWDRNYIANFWDIDTNPIIISLIPLASLIFRGPYVRPANEVIHLKYTEKETFLAFKEYGLSRTFCVEGTLPPQLCLVHRVEKDTFDNPYQLTRDDYPFPDPVNPYITDTDELIWDTYSGLLIINTPYVQGAVGYWENQSLSFEDVTISSSSPFAAIFLISLTFDPIAISNSLLLVACARAMNTNMIWNEDSTSLIDWGEGPVLMQPVNANITLNLPGVDSIYVFPLDSIGDRKDTLTVAYNMGNNYLFTIDGSYMTPWYEIFVTHIPTASDGKKLNQLYKFRLYPSFPNPFNSHTRIKFSVPTKGYNPHTVLKIYNVSGQLVKVLVNKNLKPGIYTITWDGKNDLGRKLSAGIYFYQLKIENKRDTKKLILAK